MPVANLSLDIDAITISLHAWHRINSIIIIMTIVTQCVSNGIMYHHISSYAAAKSNCLARGIAAWPPDEGGILVAPPILSWFCLEGVKPNQVADYEDGAIFVKLHS